MYAWYAGNSGSRAPKKGDFYGYDKKDWRENKWKGKTHTPGKNPPIHGDCTTCTAMSGNGCRIYIMKVTMAHKMMEVPG
jgi:hypothetical protein